MHKGWRCSKVPGRLIGSEGMSPCICSTDRSWVGPGQGCLTASQVVTHLSTAQEGAAVFQASFQALKESSTVHKACPFRELAFNGRQVSLKEIDPACPIAAQLPGLHVMRRVQPSLL